MSFLLSYCFDCLHDSSFNLNATDNYIKSFGFVSKEDGAARHGCHYSILFHPELFLWMLGAWLEMSKQWFGKPWKRIPLRHTWVNRKNLIDSSFLMDKLCYFVLPLNWSSVYSYVASETHMNLIVWEDMYKFLHLGDSSGNRKCIIRKTIFVYLVCLKCIKL